MVKKRKGKKHKFYEYFKIKKKGKEKIIKKEGVETIPQGNKEQIKKHNKVLRNLFVGILVVLIIILAVWYTHYNITHFEYNGLDFKIVREGELILYNTQLPVLYNGNKATYNFYLRNDPRKLNDVGFDGEIAFKPQMIVNATGDLSCDGFGVIAVENLQTLYRIIGTEVIQNKTASCDPAGEYIYLNLEESNSTYIEQAGPACYTIHISNCEILEGTEKFMIETLMKVHEDLL